MWKKIALIGFVLGMLLALTLPVEAETGRFQVLVNGVLHTIGYQVFTDQRVNDLRDPARFRFREGPSTSLEVFDDNPTRVIRKVSVEVPPTPLFPEGAELDVPVADADPDQIGIDFWLGLHYPDAYVGTFTFVIKLTTGDKIKVSPFPMTLRRLPDLQNVEFLDNTTKPVIRWSTIPGAQRYKVKVQDPETALSLFVTNPFPAAAGDVQTVDLKAPPTGGFPIGWTGMEVGKRYVIRIEGRLDGPVPIPPPVLIPLPPTGNVPGPVPGQGRITRSVRRVEYTPLEPAP